MKAYARGAVTLDILLVEDDPLLSAQIGAVLRQLGFSVAGVASTAQEALTLAKAVSPKLALVDARISDPTGGEAIAAMLRQRGIAVVLLTDEPAGLHPAAEREC